MSDDTSTHQGQGEVIIVKKITGGGGGHHGGAWKIAYADFVTAMMAFFLVMWLVNAANEETKATIASYFNPIKLPDEKPATKGIKKSGEAEDGKKKMSQAETEGKETKSSEDTADGKKDSQDASSEGETTASAAGEESDNSEADYFENPYAVLAEIVLDAGKDANISKKGDGGAQISGSASGATGGEAYRDPFDPDFWNKQINGNPGESQETENISGAGDTPEAQYGAGDAEDKRLGSGDMVDKFGGSGDDLGKGGASSEEMSEGGKTSTAEFDGDQGGKEFDQQLSHTGEDETEQIKSEEALLAQKTAPGDEDISDGKGRLADQDMAAKEMADEGTAQNQDEMLAEISPDELADQLKLLEELKNEAKELKEQIMAALDGSFGKLAEGLEVTPAEGGLLVSLNEQDSISMFNVGSAVPRAEMIMVMEKIGRILNERDGAIAIRGHTDARPFSSGGNDNWRLSMARAHSAYFMLVRGGIPEARVSQVSGFADRRLKDPENPFSNINRRIEILIEAGAS